MIMTFGKYKGTPVSQIEDLQYLTWLLREINLSHDLKQAIKDKVERIKYYSR